MDMPTSFPLCGEVYDLDDLLPMPRSNDLCCEECLEELEGESHDS